MPHVNSKDYNEYMRQYRRKHSEKINLQRAQRELWRRISEEDELRGRASDILDVVLGGMSSEDVEVIFGLIRQCTPRMLDELVSRAKKLT